MGYVSKNPRKMHFVFDLTPADAPPTPVTRAGDAVSVVAASLSVASLQRCCSGGGGEANFTRIVDRLRGAMVGFCQCEEAKIQSDTEP